MKETKVTVKIPRPLYRKIQMVIDESGFSSPTDFIVFVLRDLVGEVSGGIARVSDEKSGDEAATPPPADLEAVKQKLRNLGYL